MKARLSAGPSDLVILGEQTWLLPILRSDMVEEEDGYLVGHDTDD